MKRTGLASGTILAMIFILFVGTSVQLFAQGGTWAVKAPMPTARHDMATSPVNGVIYAIGGKDLADNDLGTVEAYDPASNTWTTKASMPMPRWRSEERRVGKE